MTMPLPESQPVTDGQRQPAGARRETPLRLVEPLVEIPTRVVCDDPDVPSWEEGGRIGTSPPVPQPGSPGMSQLATDISRVALSCSVATVPPGLIAIGVMVASENADPTVIGWICAGICAAPVALSVPILAVGRLARRAKEVVEAAPPVVHNHLEGSTIHAEQHEYHSRTNGLIATTKNSANP